jgi:cytochrome b subunit of formate dehydrogenase
MNLAERVQHWLLLTTFLTLMLTGLPLFFHEFKFFKWVLASERAFMVRGVLHRIAAVVLIVNIVWHIVYAAFTDRGRQNFKAMIPKFKDLRDAFELFGHNVGLTQFLFRRGILKKFLASHPYWLFKEAPLFDRYNFIEKFEYWAVAWGSLVMILSGFFMWNVELSLLLFPLWVHDIFIIVHGYEALLAFLAVIIWHMYNVHLNPEVFPMSKVWLNGRITGKELRLLHPLEYRRIAGERQKAGHPAREGETNTDSDPS